MALFYFGHTPNSRIKGTQGSGFSVGKRYLGKGDVLIAKFELVD